MGEPTKPTHTVKRGQVKLDEFTDDNGMQHIRMTAGDIPFVRFLTLAELDDLFFALRRYRRHRLETHGKYWQRGHVCEVCGKPVNDRAERCYDHRFVPEYWWQEEAEKQAPELEETKSAIGG